MPYKIDEELCLACGCCAESCPAGAIDLSENGTYYVIDRDVCLSCGTCA
ncbi:MAG: 4Fe-4S binding protein, partial [Lachnospiraceae bacterium]|nr:4Fe-4S binding protein [Lachnospiraceae bacterium]